MKTTPLALLLLLTFSACSAHKASEEVTTPVENRTISLSALQQVDSSQKSDYSVVIDEAADFETRVMASVRYFQNLDIKISASNSRQEGLSQFADNLEELYHNTDSERLNPLKTGKNKAVEAAFMALALTASPSVLAIMESALTKDHNNVSLLRIEDLFIYGQMKAASLMFMNARMDLAATLALKQLTTKDKQNLGQKTKGLLFKASAGMMGGVDLPETYDKLDDEAKEQIKTLISISLKAKKFLLTIGLEPELHKTIRSGLGNIDFNEKKINKSHYKVMTFEDEKKESIRLTLADLLG